MTSKPIHIIGGGLAGSEAAWQIARSGHSVVLHEMRPHRMTEAHVTEGLAELVCSNSFRSDDALNNAVGLIHAEMRMAGSLIMRCADETQVPAGSALAVDREAFSQKVTAALEAEPNIEICREEITGFPPEEWGQTIIASGPLTGSSLAEGIAQRTGQDALAFFDAIAPIVHFDSINMDVAWFQSRYDKVGPGGTGADYINCPLDRDQYEAFVDSLLDGPKTEFKEWEGTPYFEGCMPVEVMAERGRETMRYGPLKPMGLTNRHKPDEKPYAVVQLRQDNALGTLYNMVGFQTKLRYGAQAEIFRTIPGLEDAEFARLGGLHRNTYLDSPNLLSPSLQLKSETRIRFAGQMTGCEGYVESAAIGLLAGRFTVEERDGQAANLPPATTAMGALLAHITGGHISSSDEKKRSFQPMNVNFGLFPPVDAPNKHPDGKRLRGKEKTVARKQALARRALTDASRWLNVPAPDLSEDAAHKAA
ncbi:MAG: methylenetetrahydrofolate--tRNA-(uracil(54)-C(5))-methyltransferase (FADH(2)-oxidizing) TrmFO [Pseudomonadota bacterium]